MPKYSESFLYRFLTAVADHDASAVVQGKARELLAEMDAADEDAAATDEGRPSEVPQGSQALVPPPASSEPPARFLG